MPCSGEGRKDGVCCCVAGDDSMSGGVEWMRDCGWKNWWCEACVGELCVLCDMGELAHEEDMDSGGCDCSMERLCQNSSLPAWPAAVGGGASDPLCVSIMSGDGVLCTLTASGEGVKDDILLSSLSGVLWLLCCCCCCCCCGGWLCGRCGMCGLLCWL